MSNEHDYHHDHDYRNWAEKAKVNGWEEAGALLEEAAEIYLAAKDRYQKIMVLIRND